MKIGTTSYIYPDDIIPNVRKLTGLVDDIELVLFEGKDYSNLPSVADVETLRQISEQSGMSYTVHLPIDLDICSADDEFRKFSLKRTIEIAKLTSPLNPRVYVLHLPRKNVDSEEKWISRTMKSLSEMSSELGNEKICIENLGYPAEHILPIIGHFGFSLCLDICHAVRCADDWRKIFEENFSSVKVIHFYGAEIEGRGHIGLQEVDRSYVESVVDMVMYSGYSELLTLEVFGTEDFFQSKKIFDEEVSSWQERFSLRAG